MELVRINEKTYQISVSPSNNRNAIAKLKDGVIYITVPSRWPAKERQRIMENLRQRAIKAISLGKWGHKEKREKVQFSHGQKVVVLGQEFNISFLETENEQFYSKSEENLIEVRMPPHPKKHKIASGLVRKHITKSMMPKLFERIRNINGAYFGSNISKVILRDNLSRWGSCSSDNRISLNFRLLLLPEEILDYVIIHELAHTKYRSHGKRFWNLVEKVVPDYRKRVKWLRENGWNYPLPKVEQIVKETGQQTLSSF